MLVSRVFLVSLTLFALALSVPCCLASAEDERLVSAIEEAEEAVASAYRAVLEAEGAGAEVNGLAALLNNACSLLVQARFFQGVGNFDEAFRLANLCVEIGGDVVKEAAVLRDSAVREAEWNLRVTIALSALSIGLIAFTSFYGWRVFKRRYYRRVLEMKPEVVSVEP